MAPKIELLNRLKKKYRKVRCMVVEQNEGRNIFRGMRIFHKMYHELVEFILLHVARNIGLQK